ncbi:MAG: hypothetical protein PHE95_04675 [Candidatus Methanomethylophilus sp.]|nr:hypothetical protein [Methanomethylophilus sp.]
MVVEERPRTVPSAEVFLAESVMDGLADLGDRAFAEGRNQEGVLLGTFYHDGRGFYAVITDFRSGSDPVGAVGRYRAEPRSGCAPAAADLLTQEKLFGQTKSYLMVLTGSDSSFIVIKAEDGVLRPAKFVLDEGQ